MSRIFLSHSSGDELEAIALRDWLAQHGWDDVFLDLDPHRGLLAGERWQEALRRAADRCEAVVFIVTPAWAQSKWCLAEFLLAKSLRKRIFGAILKPVELSELPTELTSEWQLSHLAGDGPTTLIAFSHKGVPHQIALLAEGLTGLRIGLERAGLDARYFPWPPPDDPGRSPYRGLVPLEERDAAIYFGRDAQIMRGLDALRGMRATGTEQLFVILGPSGCGKSSFLRAGLFPRLKRDDRHFVPLEIIRPERQPITGERGLAGAIHKAGVDLGLADHTLGAIKKALIEDTGQLFRFLSEIQQAARTRLRATSEDAAPPTLLLSIDQAEELFSPVAADEARRLLALIGSTLRDADRHPPLAIVVFTIRSDRYEPLQTAAELSGLKSEVFDDLKPMPSQQFKEVITGPAQRASLAGHRLEFKPDLVEQLLSDCVLGADTLPLLALTLSRLYRDYGSDGDLRLDEYRTMGGMGSVVNSEVELVLARDQALREAQLHQLNAAFIPWLATINPDTDEPMRRLSRYADLPAESRPLIDALADRRLLVIDQRNQENVVEVAHEALLRQWGELASWLRAEREDLKLAHAVEQAARDWQSRGRRADWLLEGERLAVAEALAAKPSYRRRLEPVSEFLHASRRRDSERREEEERRRQAELVAARDKQVAAEALARSEHKTRVRQRYFIIGLSAVLVIALVAASLALRAQQTAESRALAATALNRLGTLPDLALALSIEANAASPTDQARDSLRQALTVSRLEAILRHDGPVNTARFDADGRRVVTASDDAHARVWDAATGRLVADLVGHRGPVTTAAFDSGGRFVVTASEDGTARVWDPVEGKELFVLDGQGEPVTSAAFRPDGQRIVTTSEDGAVRVWDTATARPIAEMKVGGEVYNASYDPEGARIVMAGFDGAVLADGDLRKQIRLTDDLSFAATFSRRAGFVAAAEGEMSEGTALVWSADALEHGQSAPLRLSGHKKFIRDLDFSPDGRFLAAASEPTSIRVWNVEDGTFESLTGHQFDVHSIRFNHDGTLVVTGGQDGTARIWRAATGTMVAVLSGHSADVNAAEFSRNGASIVTASNDRTARVWRTDFIASPMVERLNFAQRVAIARDARQVLIGYADGTVRTWNLDLGTLAGALGACDEGFLEEPQSLFDNGDRQVWTTCRGVIRKWDASSGRRLAEWALPADQAILESSLTADGLVVLAKSGSEDLRVFGLGERAQEKTALGGHGVAISGAFGANGSLAATGTMSGDVALWSVKNGNLLGVLGGHTERVMSVAFNSDGSRVATGSWDRSARIWDVTSRSTVAVLEPHGSDVLAVKFSPDGRFVATGEQNGTVRVWEVPSGNLVMATVPHTFPVNDIAFTAGGDGIVTVSNDGCASFVPCHACGTLPDLLERAQRHLPAGFDRHALDTLVR